VLTSPGMIEVYLLVLSLAGLVGCAVLCQASWRERHWISLVAWNLGVLAWGWLSVGELLWNVVGWAEWVTRLPRALVFRSLMVAGIWLLVLAHRRRR
jgi:hypothetical protein